MIPRIVPYSELQVQLPADDILEYITLDSPPIVLEDIFESSETDLFKITNQIHSFNSRPLQEHQLVYTFRQNGKPCDAKLLPLAILLEEEVEARTLVYRNGELDTIADHTQILKSKEDLIIWWRSAKEFRKL